MYPLLVHVKRLDGAVDGAPADDLRTAVDAGRLALVRRCAQQADRRVAVAEGKPEGCEARTALADDHATVVEVVGLHPGKAPRGWEARDGVSTGTIRRSNECEGIGRGA